MATDPFNPFCGELNVRREALPELDDCCPDPETACAADARDAHLRELCHKIETEQDLVDLLRMLLHDLDPAAQQLLIDEALNEVRSINQGTVPLLKWKITIWVKIFFWRICLTIRKKSGIPQPPVTTP